MSYEENWPVAIAWLYGWVDTSVPGYRQVQDGATVRQVADGYYMMPDLMDAIGDLPGWAVGADGHGRLALAAPDDITWPDRLGWLLGMDAEPGDTELTRFPDARTVSPVMIPLMKAVIQRVKREEEAKVEVDRFLRGHAAVWGSADLWTIDIGIHRSAFQAFDAGFFCGGRVTLSGSGYTEHQSGAATAWGPSNPTGFLTGQSLGYRGDWRDRDTQQFWDGRLLLATEVS